MSEDSSDTAQPAPQNESKATVLAARAGAWVAGSDKPELDEVRVGFIPLTDCASVVMAAVKGFGAKYGIKLTLSREPSWAAVRDKLVSGELHAAQVLYGLVYGVQLGIGSQKKAMAVLMSLNNNGQSITLSRQLHEQGVSDGASLARLIQAQPREYTFAQTFPTGTHAMWLYYWLASIGVHPLKDVKTIVVPPPQMVTHMAARHMDGFCAGEPWGARAVFDNIGFTAATSQDIWADHPEKVLGCSAEFVQRYPNTARALVAAVLEASRYVDEPQKRAEVAGIIAGADYVNAPEEVIRQRFLGCYTDGLGRSWQDAHPLQFFNEGAVNFPYLSDGMWFMTQHKRWGLLKEHPDYLAVAQAVNHVDVYRDGACAAGVALPGNTMRASTLVDGVVWDGSAPQAYAEGFSIKA